MFYRVRWSFIILSFLFLPGCAHVISSDLRAAADPSLTLRQTSQDPNAYKGRIVLWGGEIIETVNQKEGGTLIEVFQRPLGWMDEPRETLASEGRFLVHVEKYLDPYLFRRGRKVTVAGEILGEEVKPLGEMDYHYPLLLAKQIYLWADYYYAYPPYYYYSPWWGYPYGWFYPYGWGFNFYYYR